MPRPGPCVTFWWSARSKAGPKRGGGRRRVVLDEAVALTDPPADEVLALHDALADLEKEDSLKAQIVSLRSRPR